MDESTRPVVGGGRTTVWRVRLLTLFTSIGVVWGVSLYGVFVDRGLPYDLAVVPRQTDGLAGILGMPFVHGSVAHLVANTVPMLVFGSMLLIRGARYFFAVVAGVAVVGGLALWVFGRQAAHIGASGVVFGLFAFLVVRGLYERRVSSITISVMVAIVYGGSMIFGLVPRDDGVSWEAHLFGLLAGILAARVAYAIDNRSRERSSP